MKVRDSSAFVNPLAVQAPPDWRRIRLKHTIDGCKNGIWGEESTGEDEIVCVRVADFDRTTGRVLLREPTYRSVTESQRRGRLLKRGDLLIEKSGGGATQPVGAVVLFGHEEPAVCSNFIARMPVAAGLEPRFLCYVHHALYAIGINQRAIKQTTGIQNLDLAAYLDELIAVPSIHDQVSIADFLDEKTSAIDALIEKKERLVQLVQQKLLATITRTVAHGLDPDASMRDSGVEWLGNIPAHWHIAPLYAKYSVQLGKMLSQEASDGPHPAAYLRNANVQWGRVILDDLREMNFSWAERRKFALRKGDLLVCEGGEVGRTAIWYGEMAECYYQKAIHRVRPIRSTEHPPFLFYVMRAAAHREVFLAEGNQSTIPHLTAEKLRRHRFPFPPPPEQINIAQYLDHVTKAADDVVGHEQRIAAKLREYRQTLISAAVTGQIDVRDRASQADSLLQELTA